MQEGGRFPKAMTAFLLGLCAIGSAGCDQTPSDDNLSADEVANELADMRIDPGLWLLASEVIDVSAPDLPREVRNHMVGPRSRLRHCITPEQAASPSANFLAARADGQCRYRSFSVREGRIEGLMTCPDAEARMTGRFERDAYLMRMDMVSPMPGGTDMTIKVRAVGRRIGECPESS